MKILYVFTVLAIAMSSAFGETTLTRSQCMSEDKKNISNQTLERVLVAQKVGDYQRGCELMQQYITQLQSCQPYLPKDVYDNRNSMAYGIAKPLCTCARTNAC